MVVTPFSIVVIAGACFKDQVVITVAVILIELKGQVS
jgi:hypothetical protein